MTNPLLARFAGVPALVAPERLAAFESALHAAASHPMMGELLAADPGDDDFWTELGDRVSARLRPYVVRDGILLLPVRGVLLSGFPYQFFDLATGYEYIWKAFERGMADQNVAGIALIVDSPGGEVSGNFDLVDAMFAMRGTKPVRAFAAEHAYSAAYSIGSVADRLIVARTGGVGSVGVITMHMDLSKALDDRGVKITLIYSGAHKADGNPYEPLPEGVKASVQKRVDAMREIFVSTVARNRGLTPDLVRGTEAAVFMADEAVSNGFADDVGALEASLADFVAELTAEEEDDTMSVQDKAALTVATVKADHKEIAEALVAEGHAAGKTEAETAAKDGVDKALTADRARVAEIMELSEPGAEAIIAEGIKSGASAGDVALKIAKSPDVKETRRKTAALAALSGDDAQAQGATPTPEGGGSGETPKTAEGWTAEWNAAPEGQKPRGTLTASSYVKLMEREQRQKGA